MHWTINLISSNACNRKLQNAPECQPPSSRLSEGGCSVLELTFKLKTMPVLEELMPAASLPLALALNGLLVLQLHN